MGYTRYEIDIQNQQRGTRVSKKKLSQFVQKILKALGWRRIGLSVVLVNGSQMRRLHRQYLHRDRTTDVLAFPQIEGASFPCPGIPLLGDVVVSVDTAKRMGPRFGNHWQEELLLYICHGILHLMGYRDSTPSKKVQMNAKQNRVLRKVLGQRWLSKRQTLLF